MKKLFLAFLTVALTLCAGSAAWAIVQGTPHDVNVMQDTTGLEICAMCHTPHSGTGAYPLWNRTQTSQTYTMYASDTFDMIDTTATAPRGVSALCMVCHNGVASQLVNYPGPKSTQNTAYDFVNNDPNLTSPWTNLGTGMVDDHPISFTYDPSKDNVTDNNGFPVSVGVNTGTKVRKVIQGTGGDYPLYGTNQDQMECATCHSVHHTADYPGPVMDNGASAGTQVYFLRTDNAGSRMCTDCHTKR